MGRAINSVLMDQPRMYGQLVCSATALMKRRAQLGGIRVGIFEEAYEKRRHRPLYEEGEPNAAEARWRPR